MIAVCYCLTSHCWYYVLLPNIDHLFSLRHLKMYIPSNPPKAIAPESAEQKMKTIAAIHIGLKASVMSLLYNGIRCLNSLMTPPKGTRVQTSGSKTSFSGFRSSSFFSSSFISASFFSAVKIGFPVSAARAASSFSFLKCQTNVRYLKKKILITKTSLPLFFF